MPIRFVVLLASALLSLCLHALTRQHVDLTCYPQSRPVDEFMEDFEQQEKVFKEEVAQARERNAERKVSCPLSCPSNAPAFAFSVCS